MTEKFQERAAVVRQEAIGNGIYSLYLKTGSVAAHAVPGQFVSLYCADKSRLLPRPISICRTDPENGVIRLVYRLAGEGTKEFSGLQPGDSVDIIGPLGNGYPLSKGSRGRSALLIGGGIGIPPLLELAAQLEGKREIVLGFRSEQFLTEEFKSYGSVYIATEDGSFGTRGNVLDAVNAHRLTADVIYACGPMVMLHFVRQFAIRYGIPCYLSLEERMACGVGACLGCVCKTVKKDAHSQVNNARVCTEGPVFNALDVEI